MFDLSKIFDLSKKLFIPTPCLNGKTTVETWQPPGFEPGLLCTFLWFYFLMKPSDAVDFQKLFQPIVSELGYEVA